MKKTVLIQLPVPQINFGRQTGNIPLAAACLRQAAGREIGAEIAIVPESVVSYLGDAALIDLLASMKPDILGFTVTCWNLDRSLFMARALKRKGNVRIVFGGPEITPDNQRLSGAAVDFMVFGEGESVFRRLLTDDGFWANGSASGTSDGFFSACPSPYPEGLLEPEFSGVMLLETQRGCPYHCNYCYYNKSRSRLAFAEENRVLDAVGWARDHGVNEIYLLDPCLSARPRIELFIEKLAAQTESGRPGFVSEIRAEAVTAALADRFLNAGFLWFEVGLQSTNPAALDRMNRKTDLKRFVDGARHLKDRGITPIIDLILGLPGDDPEGFKRSVDFLIDHDIADDVHLYPLSVLPGTEFRHRSRALGLTYTPAPPYTVLETPTFSREAMRMAVEYAEENLDAAFYPFPDLNIAWKTCGKKTAENVSVPIGGEMRFSKIYVNRAFPEREIRTFAGNMTYPYQVFVDPCFAEEAFLCRLLAELTGANPFTPVEMVFLGPRTVPKREKLLSAIRLKRPHFLDLEERFLFGDPGNRAVVFTIVLKDPELRFSGAMERQVFWWDRRKLPEKQDLEDLSGLDGVLIDSPVSTGELTDWQDRFVSEADDLPQVSFSDMGLQHQWLQKTNPDQWAESIGRRI